MSLGNFARLLFVRFENSPLLYDPDKSFSNPKSRVEWFSECGLECVKKSHCVRDTVERQSSCSVIQKHSYSRGMERREMDLFIIMSDIEILATVGQSPGLVIKPKSAVITFSFTTNSSVGNCYRPVFPTALNLPVTATTQTLTTQNIRQPVKSLWKII